MSQSDGFAQCAPTGWRVEYTPVVASTQDLARQAALRGEPSRQVYLADYQSAGRGRLGRTWQAPLGSSLLVSLLFRELDLTSVEHTQAVSVALCEALEKVATLAPRIKWPNDVLLADRKVAGVLAESTDAAPGYVIVGLGLNVAWQGERPPDVPPWATAVDAHAHPAPERAELLSALLLCLDEWLCRLSTTQGHDALRQAWKSRLWRRGERVTVHLEHGPVTGVLAGTDANGALMIETDAGERLTILAGDLELPGRSAPA